MVYVESQLITEKLATSEGVHQWLEQIGADSNPGDIELIRDAFVMAEKAHQGQVRASGEPYVNHVVAVADILVNLHLDYESVAAAFLHDVVEDSDVSLNDVRQQFGHSIAELVDGVTKMHAIDLQVDQYRHHHDQVQAESLRKLLLAMAKDVRVVLIKLADRLHNMRTLKFLPADKQRRIAQETIDIYAPLANRLGIWQIKWELEDLSLRYLEPFDYKQIASSLDERRVDRERYIENIVKVVSNELNNVGIQALVTGRPKHIYSIWRKMKKKGISFHNLYDVRAIRIIVDNVQQCYAALGVVHTLWRHIPNEFDDYIATPKENRYQSIHTAVIGPRGKSIEIQIRSEGMHDHAEWGVAAHWRYKEQSKNNADYDQKIAWLRQLLEWKEEAGDAGDFIDRFKSEVFQDRVYVLTPTGDVMDLPQASTPLDFAYHVHTEVGNHCRGAKVNGRMVPLTYELKSGEQVEILTTKNGKPSRDWLNPQLGYLNSSRALSKARHWFKLQDFDENSANGHVVLEKELNRLGVRNLNHNSIAKHFHYEKTDDFLSAIGRGDINSIQLANAVNCLTHKEQKEKQITPVTRIRQRETGGDITIQGVGNLLTHIGQCCKPVLGDPIIGFITQGRGVTIHKKDCRNILKMDDIRRTRLIAVEWATQSEAHYAVEISVYAVDRVNLLRDIFAIFTNESINVTASNTHSDKDKNTAKMHFNLEIKDVNQLSRVLNRLLQLQNVMDVRRVTT
ncbi:Inactive (p)ppGpp 3'-pyrophosphohydrolase domain / GTP pyrophosphokinase, (p)ppGpp synthetase I [hydrothermal vent metagenome]|uniref:Inactive (P)ppGpp 3'-pyrophosphohydrolase domain / GTP pyrophosphokinase, (P)ppGpp synthetase I n=1 Tax=hydrothermal vent metagenome TaxID=652676 RepID=A0A3B1B074_9ZZZZ